MALPFFIMKYEKELQSIASNSDKKEVFLNEFRELMIRLKNSDIIIDSESVYNDLVSLMKYIADYELENYADLQKEVGDIMGGKVLDLPSDKLREQFAEGKAEGELKNALDVYKKCISRGMTKEEALDISGLPEDKIPNE